MYKEGHIGAALVVYSPLGLLAVLLADSQLAFIGAVVPTGLAMLPDVDMRIPLLKHRGPPRTVWFAIIIGLLIGLFSLAIRLDGGMLVTLFMGVFGFLVGTLSIYSHLLADALTLAGIRPFWPRIEAEYTFELVRASYPIANYLLLGLAIGICAIALRIASVLA